MSYLTNVKKAMRLQRLPTSLTLWKAVVGIAVTSNSYSIDDEIRVLLLIKVGRIDLLIEWADAISQQVYGTPMLHYRMHQIAALIRKYPFPEKISGFNPRKTALEKFNAAEHRCKRYNQRFRAIRSTGRDTHAAATWHARKWIEYVLGHTPNIDACINKSDFTPGSCIGVHGNATNLAKKLTAKSWTVSDGSVLSHAISALWNNSQVREYIINNGVGKPYCMDPENFRAIVRGRAKEVRYNKISFVPKTAKSMRTIAVEPFLNSFLQKGVDQVMRLRLNRVGLDLSDQSANQEMARRGSVDREDPYCTIDLSSASDTIATEVVWELLPPEWVDFLDQLRSKSYKLGASAEVHKYHKFASTGNGFCFPLETLIFASLCHAACKEMKKPDDFRVYGDDIIVRQSVAHRVLELLGHFGFIPNSRKTFTSGPFRESCGADWHMGVNVRPIFLDHPLESFEQIFGFHNQSLRRERWVADYFAEIREYLLHCIPAPVRFVSHFDPAYTCEGVVSKRNFADSTTGETIDGAFWVPFDVYMASPFSRWNSFTQSWSHVALRSVATVDPDFGECMEEDNLLFLIGGLRGGSSKGPFTLRYSAQTKPVIINEPVKSPRATRGDPE